MHPLLIIVPVVGLIFGPRVWVGRVIKQHTRKEQPGLAAGKDLARELLDRHQLQHVKVEITDIGDHYDPGAKAVRLSRDTVHRRTLSAVTTAAHEVAHAIQDASGYGPFVWRTRLAAVAQVTGQVGTAVLVAVPTVSLLTRQPMSPVIFGGAIFAMLGTGVAVQLAALPTELDASFRRALPILRQDYINDSQAKDARLILLASSLTYIASSLAAMLNFWPWVGRHALISGGTAGQDPATVNHHKDVPILPLRNPNWRSKVRRSRFRGGVLEDMIRTIGKPILRICISSRSINRGST